MSRARSLVAIGAGAVGVVLTCSLGQWQMGRAGEKLAAEAQLDAALREDARVLSAADLGRPAPAAPLRVVVSGRLLHDKSVWLDNRQLDGRPGFWLVTPLALDGGGHVLILRGWAPRDVRDRTRLPPVGRPDGVLRIEGLALARVPRLLALGGAADGPVPGIWQNLDLAAYERATQLPLAQVVVQQTSALDDGLARNWPRPASGVDRHRGYAVQWYALASLLGVLTLFFGTRAVRHHWLPCGPSPS